MPQASSNGVKLYYVEAGSGDPVVFVHDFAGDHRSWEPQLRYLSRRYRCIAYNARGYPPSQTPDDPDQYSQQLVRDDLLGLLDHLALRQVHLVGSGMGSFTALHLALEHPQRVRSLALACTGYGALAADREQFIATSLATADLIEAEGIANVTAAYAVTPERLPLKRKDPRGWQEFATMLAHHSSDGAACTLRGLQARRPGFDVLEDRLSEMQTPLLIIAGDEDTPSLDASLYLKRVVPSAALAVLPKSGHLLNLEEPLRFNDLLLDFFAAVETKRWERRDTSASPQ